MLHCQHLTTHHMSYLTALVSPLSLEHLLNLTDCMCSLHGAPCWANASHNSSTTRVITALLKPVIPAAATRQRKHAMWHSSRGISAERNCGVFLVKTTRDQKGKYFKGVQTLPTTTDIKWKHKSFPTVKISKWAFQNYPKTVQWPHSSFTHDIQGCHQSFSHGEKNTSKNQKPTNQPKTNKIFLFPKTVFPSVQNAMVLLPSFFLNLFVPQKVF